MRTLQIEEVVNKEQYTKFWEDTNGHFMQSWEWGEIKDTGQSVKRYQLTLGGQVEHVLSLHIKKAGIVKYAYIPKTRLKKKEYLDKLKVLTRTLGLDFLIFEQDTDVDISIKAFPSIVRFENIQPHCTNIVDLSVTEESLWQNLDGKYRRNINKSIRSGVVVKKYTSGQKPLDDFYDVLNFILSNTSYIMYGKEYFQKLWITLSASNLATIFLAHDKENQLCGAYLLVYDNLGAYELYGGVNQIGRTVEAGYLMKWTMMRDAKESSKHYYDHWGVAPKVNDKYLETHELYNISKFKAGFGGQDKEYDKSLVLVHSSWKYSLFKITNRLRKIFLQILKITK